MDIASIPSTQTPFSQVPQEITLPSTTTAAPMPQLTTDSRIKIAPTSDHSRISVDSEGMPILNTDTFGDDLRPTALQISVSPTDSSDPVQFTAIPFVKPPSKTDPASWPYPYFLPVKALRGTAADSIGLGATRKRFLKHCNELRLAHYERRGSDLPYSAFTVHEVRGKKGDFHCGDHTTPLHESRASSNGPPALFGAIKALIP